jgi:hypothetical protein
MPRPTAETIARDIGKAADALATVADNMDRTLTPMSGAVHRYITEAADAAYLAADLARDVADKEN